MGSAAPRIDGRLLGLIVAPSVVLLAAIPLASTQVPPPPGTRSVQMIDEGVVVLREPRMGAKRRGLVKIGTRLPLCRRVMGDGCETGFWAQVGPDAFICERFVQMSREAPAGTPQPVVRSGELLPHSYAFVRVDGTRAFLQPSDYDADEYTEAYGSGFGLAITDRVHYSGVDFVKTVKGFYVAEDSVRYVRGLDFAGVQIAAGAALDVAWVVREGAQVRDAAGRRAVRRAPRLEELHIAGDARPGWLRLADGSTISARDVARPSVSAPPDTVTGAATGERWIDVDVASQTLVAYEGTRPVFTTLVSTGRATREHATPVGTFRIWIKLATTDMDDLEREDVERNYAIQAVPWVQFFEASNGFHAAFWHRDFGHRHSHGCVNLSPRDARFLFDFTRPALPPGWTAILPTDRDKGTVVRVRDPSARSRPATARGATATPRPAER